MITMKRVVFSIILSLFALIGCQSKDGKTTEAWVEHALDVAQYQLNMSAVDWRDSLLLPRSTYASYDLAFVEEQMGTTADKFTRRLWANHDGESRIRLSKIYDWTSGFFPGSLWYAYELTGNKDLLEPAIHYTNLLNDLRYYRGSHDIGFMVNCSYGNALRLEPQDSVKQIIIETAENLCTRFDPTIGAIRSWNHGSWNFPVIIDNMMNLDLLFNATKLSGNKKYYDVAVAHAETTIKNHFRPDYTSYHVVSYNNDGTIESKGTHQGLSDDSSWSRGQAWAVYGYVSCYRETNKIEFLHQAQNIADMIIKLNTPEDKVPYWDFDAIDSDETPRDASAAAIIASAFIEMSTMLPDGQVYFDYAVETLKSLSTDAYLAKKGENFGFILMHSVGSLPHATEIDTPLNYADYYYLESLKRYLDLTQN